MSDIEFVDLTEEALSILLPQFKGKPNIEAILKGNTSYLDASTLTVQNILDGLHFESMSGDLLDKVGKLLNVLRGGLSDEDYKTKIQTVLRGGLSDEDYKTKIQTQIFINASDGSIKSLIRVLNTIVGERNYRIVESFPAEVQVRLYEPQNILTESIIGELLPIGVKGVFFQNPYTDKTAWELTEVGEADNPFSVLPDVADLDTTDVVVVDVIFT